MSKDFSELEFGGPEGKFAFLDNLFCDAMRQCRGKRSTAMAKELCDDFDKYMNGIEVGVYVDADWFLKRTFDKYKGNQIPTTNKNHPYTIHLRIFAYYLGQLCKREDFIGLLNGALAARELSVPGKTAFDQLHYMLKSTFRELYDEHYAVNTGMPKYVLGTRPLSEGALVNPKDGFMAFAQLDDPLGDEDLLCAYFTAIGNSQFAQETRVAYLPAYSVTSGFCVDREHLKCRIHGEEYWKIGDQIKNLLDETVVNKDGWIEVRVAEERSSAAERGYHEQPDTLWIRSMMFDDRKMLTLDCGHTGEGGYLYHKVWQKAFFDLCAKDPSKVESDPYLDLLDNPADRLTSFMIEKNGPFHTTRAGGGVWIITSDGYIACSKRGSNLKDEPGRISYSASGSLENTGWDSRNGVKDPHGEYGPFAQISKEIKEELGVEIATDEILMSEVGVDLYGGWIQFSFFAVVPYKASELSARRNSAVDKKEFTLFFIPYHEAKSMLLGTNAPENKNYLMEASARYSLFNLVETFKSPAELPAVLKRETL